MKLFQIGMFTILVTETTEKVLEILNVVILITGLALQQAEKVQDIMKGKENVCYRILILSEEGLNSPNITLNGSSSVAGESKMSFPIALLRVNTYSYLHL